jgi:hypothetical protein
MYWYDLQDIYSFIMSNAFKNEQGETVEIAKTVEMLRKHIP